MGKLFYIMGKSASGKDKIYGRLLDNEELDLHHLVLYTTRPIRVGEKDGKQYFFVDDNKLRELRAQGKIIEERSYDTVHGIWTYFTADNGQLDLEHYNYIGIGTLESYEKLKEYYGEEILVPIYIDVEDGLRLQRAMKREGKQTEPKYQELCRRFLADCEDFSEENIAKAQIGRRFYNNEELETCINEVVEYIKSVVYS
ncbi:MAG: guanylate kinase [Lachnospiraceae bacterium]|nr:guanylate kinase [Lachnospiraceae bacterium]